ncbi:hypothetical protein Tco_0567043 [Tanacetum coccineum]
MEQTSCALRCKKYVVLKILVLVVVVQYPVTSSAAGVKKMCEILYYSAGGDIMPKRSVPVSRLWAVVDTTIASIFFYCFFVALVALLCSCRDSGESEVVQGIVLRRGAKGTGMKSVELTLSMCDIVDIYGFTVDHGYTEWFIRVNDLDRLVGNLCTIWIGRFHLHANVARFEVRNKPVKPLGPSQSNAHGTFGSFVSAARDFPPLIASVAHVSSSPALVLDDSCVVERDLSCHVMGRVKDINSIPNLRFY